MHSRVAMEQRQLITLAQMSISQLRVCARAQSNICLFVCVCVCVCVYLDFINSCM